MDGFNSTSDMYVFVNRLAQTDGSVVSNHSPTLTRNPITHFFVPSHEPAAARATAADSLPAEPLGMVTDSMRREQLRKQWEATSMQEIEEGVCHDSSFTCITYHLNAC